MPFFFFFFFEFLFKLYIQMDSSATTTSNSSSTSLVSRTKTAFHSAAAKAEKVFTDLKSTTSSPDTQRVSTKPSSDRGSLQEPDASSAQGNAKFGAAQNWQRRFKNLKKGKNWKDEKDKAKDIIIDAPIFDKKFNQMDRGAYQEKQGLLVKGTLAVGVASVATETIAFPPSNVIKQLAVAFETGKKCKSLKDLRLSRVSPSAKERSSLSFSAVKSLFALRERDGLTDLSDNEDVVSLFRLLFSSAEASPRHTNQSGSPRIPYLPREIHSAPPESFVVRISEIIGRIKNLQQMPLFWHSIVVELRRMWDEEEPVPCMPLDETPDLNYCLLHQQLQVINCCIARKRRREIAIASLDSLVREANCTSENLILSPTKLSSSGILYAKIQNGDSIVRLGADQPIEDLTLLETGEPVYTPVTQESPILTEDLIKETEELVLMTGSVGVGCSQLLSDMQAFKAANPGCILEDFIRWHSPPDWTSAELCNETTGSPNVEDTSVKRGQLSCRMQKEGNLWRELWGSSKPLPAVKQAPLFDEDVIVDNIFHELENISPSDVFEQLFLSLLSSAFVIAEAKISHGSAFYKLFFECKDYVITTCQGGLSNVNVDDVCQVYETVESILVQPEDALTVTKKSDEMSAGEQKRGFLKFNIGLSRNKTPMKDEKRIDDNRSPMLFELLDGDPSPLGKQTPPGALRGTATTWQDETEWTVI